jgi:hypothetical protein
MNSKKDWIHVTNSNNIQTSYKEDSPLYSIKMESTLKQPILNILSVFHEIDLYPSCNHKILTQKGCPYVSFILIQF